MQDKHKRYRKIEADTARLDALLVDVFLEAENFSDGKHVEARLGMFSVPEFWERSTAR